MGNDQTLLSFAEEGDRLACLRETVRTSVPFAGPGIMHVNDGEAVLWLGVSGTPGVRVVINGRTVNTPESGGGAFFVPPGAAWGIYEENGGKIIRCVLGLDSVSFDGWEEIRG